MNYLSENDYFKTSDLTLCGTLCYFGYIVELIDKTNPSKAEFVIKRDEKIDDIIQGFWTRQLMVEPIALFGFIKDLKNRLYSN